MDILAWFIVWIVGTVVLGAFMGDDRSFLAAMGVSLTIQGVLLAFAAVMFVILWAFNHVGLL